MKERETERSEVRRGKRHLEQKNKKHQKEKEKEERISQQQHNTNTNIRERKERKETQKSHNKVDPSNTQHNKTQREEKIHREIYFSPRKKERTSTT
mmetsp:Transcript_9791/g.13196  ORF Transcript_9791/g.13196 Transcript_9791/m.13196 type:complete len:96 (-) Transcript_9791:120-407(-)